MEDRKVLLSVRDLDVKFRVRGRILTAIRGISLDIYENESIAIVGESGCGKTVFTKTFSGMLDNNGFIDHGDIIFNNDELADTYVSLNFFARRLISRAEKKLNRYSRMEPGADSYRRILELKKEKQERYSLSSEESDFYDSQLSELQFKRTEVFNMKQTMEKATDKEKIKMLSKTISDYDAQIRELETKRKKEIREHKRKAKKDASRNRAWNEEMKTLKSRRAEEIKCEISDSTSTRNLNLAKEIYLSIGRRSLYRQLIMFRKLLKALRDAMMLGVNLDDETLRNGIFDNVTFRVKLLDETEKSLHGSCVLNLAKITYSEDWMKIRGRQIATIFQDPMTSLNPIITIGKQMTSVIMKHQQVSEPEARIKAMEMMKKVGITNAEQRFDDYPFQFSGGMRQRIVIAIALSCNPKILICDEPTTALDVTIQAQILKLIKDLQKEFHYTIVFITHDLGVVANVADRVAVLYAGQIVELGTVNEIFYDPRHPYTWALLSSLPQLADRNTRLYSIAGTPPSLYNRINGDAFAPRNPYCLTVDTLREPPMFQVSDTHYAKTWLLDPRSPEIQKPEAIRDIHGTLMKVFNI